MKVGVSLNPSPEIFEKLGKNFFGGGPPRGPGAEI